MKIIVGLGNPGAKYISSRHNIGFLFLDFLAEKFGVGDWKEKKKFKSIIAEGSYNDEKVLLLKPTTFMNLSGEAVVAVKQFYDTDLSDLLLVYDDIDLPFGAVRYREKGSAGTHNGMRSVLGLIGVDTVPRLRLGVESRDEELKKKWALKDYVLSNFVKKEAEKLPTVFVDGLDLLKAQEVL